MQIDYKFPEIWEFVISDINSDQLCGIRCTKDDGENSLMSVIGVYLTCLDFGVDCYKEHVKK